MTTTTTLRSSTIRARARAAAVACAPVALLIAFVSHPYIAGRLPNETAIADAIAADPARWALVHLGSAVATGLIIIAFVAIRDHLRDTTRVRPGGVGLALIVLGNIGYAVLPGIEFAPLAAIETGADAAAAQAAVSSWFVAVLVTGTVGYVGGVVIFANDIARASLLNPAVTRLVVGALVAMALSRFVPIFVVQGYVQSAAALLAFLPIAYAMWVSGDARS